MAYLLIFLASLIEGEFSLLVLAYFFEAWQVNMNVAVPMAAAGAYAGDALFFEWGRRKGSAWLQRFPKLRHRMERTGGFLARNHWFTIPFLRFQIGLRMLGNYSLGLGELTRRRYYALQIVTCLLWAAVIVPLCAWFTPFFMNILRSLGA